MPTIDWNHLRPWNNSRNSAFEELCCQLAEYEQAPQGARFIRKGTPDAGIECFWILPTGGEWGWQAKFLFLPFASTQWKQLDESVYKALEHHPNLIRYTICLPFDRPDPRGQKRNKSFLDRWKDRVTEWQARASRSGRAVEFIYWGDHELTTRLTKEEHAGRLKYWFDKEFLSQRWFENHLKEVVANAGDRYTPEVNVNLPIAQVFEGLGRTPELFAKIDSLHKGIREAFQRLSSSKIAEAAPVQAQEIERRIPTLLSLLTEIRNRGWGPLPFKGIADAEIKSTQQCVDALRAKKDSIRKTESNTTTELPDFRDQIYQLDRLIEALYELIRFSDTPCAGAANKPAVLIVGGAGSGKTHLLCDIAERRIGNGQPTVMVLGEQFGEAEPWKQIIELLKLDCTREELLGSLDAAAQAAGARALLHIDALNEGAGDRIWNKHLPGILATLENYPRIGIALTVRDSYENFVIPQTLVENHKLIRDEHYGFREHEYEAVNRFFFHFGIEPSVPILYPEFSNPQFLLLFCKGLRNQGLRRIPLGLHGITTVFDFFLDSINNKLSHPDRLNFDRSDKLVQKATEQIATEMAKRSARALPLDRAKRVIDAFLPGQQFNRSLSRQLITEGVFAEDIQYSAKTAKPQRIIRFSYERFADHRIAQLLLDSHLDRKFPKRSFGLNTVLGAFFKDDYSCWRNKGLVDALCVQIPEQVHKELPEVLPRAARGIAAVRQAFVESLLWRRTDAFSDSTRKFINDDILRYRDTSRQFWNAIITLSPIPEHPFNANALHRNLIACSMPDRDAWWSTFIHAEYRRQSAIDRLLDWAWSPLKPNELDINSTILYATALAWFFSSSNRFLRDHATKSLVKVIGDRTEILVALIEKFRSVNDPYIAERICAVAYGCATKSNDKEKLKALATTVYHWIFATSNPVTDILTRDYARGVVESALIAGAQLPFDPQKARPPYKSAWPQTIPSKNELETKYGWREDQMPQGEWSRLAIYSSVMGFGDFARYVIGTNSGSFDWINIRLGKRPPVTARERHARFLNGLNSAQKKAWNAIEKIRAHNLFAGLLKNVSETRDQKMNRSARLPVPEEDVRQAEKAFEATLSQSELKAYRADVVTYLANPRIDGHRFDPSLAQRWILQRVFDLGWSVDKFGNFDRDVNAHLWRRDAKKAERIGKKYQWIAYREFLGLVADNFEFGNPLFDNSSRKYVGPWQTFERDIDPTCALLGIAGGDKQQDSWWSCRNAYRWNAGNHNNTWIRTTQDLPSVEPMLEVVNPQDGSVWLVLETYPEWREPVLGFKDEFEDRRKWLWFQVRSFVINNKSAAKAFSHLSKQNFWGRWMPENPDYHATFLGEYYWAPALAEYDPRIDPRKEREPRLKGIGSPFMYTSGDYYSQKNSFDCSVDEGFHIFLPGQWLVKNMKLQWNGSEGRFFDLDGNLIAFDPAVSQPGPNALLIRKEPFLRFLKSSGYEVIWFLLGGKQELGGSWGRDEREGELQISGVYRVKNDKVSGRFKPKFVSFKQ